LKQNNRGMGNWQSDTKYRNRQKILEILKDREFHQYNEIKEKTQLSGNRLAVHLKELNKFIEKKEGEADSRTKYYRANPFLRSIFFQIEFSKAALDDLRKIFLRTKDLATALNLINDIVNANMLIAFSNIQSKNLDTADPEALHIFLETFVWKTFEILTLELVNLSIETKIIETIDIAETTKKLTEI
jgi:hypothetical protein